MKKRHFWIILLLPFISLAQNSIDDLLSIPYPTLLKASTDGQAIAWVFNEKGSRNIFYADGANFNNVRKLTAYEGDDGIDINQLSFTPDGKNLFYIRGNTTNRQKEAANPALIQVSTVQTLHVIEINSGKSRIIDQGSNAEIAPNGEKVVYIKGGQVWIATITADEIKIEQLFNARGSQRQLRYSPDGSKLVFVSHRGDHAFLGIYDFQSEDLQYPDPTVDIDSDPVWSPAGDKIAFIRKANEKHRLPFSPKREGHPWSIQIYDLESDHTHEAWKADPGAGSALYSSLPVVKNKLWWSTDDQIIFPWEKTGWIQLYALDAASKEVTHLTPGQGMVENVKLANDGRSIYYSTNIGDINRRHLWKVMSDGSQNIQLTKGNSIDWSPIPTKQGIALLQSTEQRSAWPALMGGSEIKLLAQEYLPKIDYDQLVSTEIIEVEATDGIRSPAILFKPHNYDPNKKYPAVIFLHGGSRRQMLQGFHYSSYYSNAYALQQYFASKGYIALSLNYRSGIGYGLAFREAEDYGIMGGSEVNDLFAAGEYLKDRRDVDQNRIALWGGSYGGCLTAHGLARRSDLFAVGVDIHGVHNWNTELPTFAPHFDTTKYPEVAELAYRSSPEYYIDGWESPVLFIHGDDDRNVPFAETVYLAELLRDRNIDFEQLIFPDEVHGFLLHENWVNAQKATFEFINRHIGENK